MGAGARLAAERDRWPEHWRVADLDREEDFLLTMLAPAEELRAVIPGMRSTPTDGEDQILLGVTSHRIVLVRRPRHSDTEPLLVLDVTECAPLASRGEKTVAHEDGHLIFDVSDDAIARVWQRIDELGSLTCHD